MNHDDLECLSEKGNPAPDDYEAMRRAVTGVVVANFGVKGIDLVIKVMSNLQHYQWKQAAPHLPTLIERMVREGSLIELCAVLPSMSYRNKTLYFPAGTHLSVTGVVKPH